MHSKPPDLVMGSEHEKAQDTTDCSSATCELLSLCVGRRKRPYDHDKAMAREAAELQEQLSAIASAEYTRGQLIEPDEAKPAPAAPRRCSLKFVQ